MARGCRTIIILMTKHSSESHLQKDMADEQRSLIRLMTFLSPSFPTGAFAYSHGLEAAFAEGLLKTSKDFTKWICSLLTHGSAWCDALFCAESWRCGNSVENLQELAGLCEAMASSKERHRETMSQGKALLDAAKFWLDSSSAIQNKHDKVFPLPVALGAIAAHLSIPLMATLTAQSHGFVSNQIQAALRMGCFGQEEGVRILAFLENDILDCASRAASTGFDDIGSCAYVADIMAMRHETMTTRIFIS